MHLFNYFIICIAYLKAFIPFSSIKINENRKVFDNTWYYTFRFLIRHFYYPDNNIRLHLVHLKNQDKIYILNTSMLYIFCNYDLLMEMGETINPPRSLFIKYKIFVNGKELNLEEKIYYKKFSPSTKIKDICSFSNYIIDELQIYKNGDEYKKWTNELETLEIKEIYNYL